LKFFATRADVWAEEYLNIQSDRGNKHLFVIVQLFHVLRDRHRWFKYFSGPYFSEFTVPEVGIDVGQIVRLSAARSDGDRSLSVHERLRRRHQAQHRSLSVSFHLLYDGALNRRGIETINTRNSTPDVKPGRHARCLNSLTVRN
jgi:hypothetical protein